MISASVTFALRQILFLAVGMLSLNALVGFRFANLFVRPLEELRASTEKIGAGELDFRFEINGHNEIETVKRSFNSMTEKISDLIEDNRRKAEVDSELKLAREVGSMLFPRDHVQLSGLEITARMNRSEQFSGEWWGYVDLNPPEGQPGVRVLLVADLQKSGTLGALAIAALRGSTAAVEAWARAKPELAADPCVVLKMLTDSLEAAGRGRFQPSLFAAVFDSASRQVRCARTGATGGIWIAPKGARVQSVAASAETHQSFPWEPGAKLFTFTPRLTAVQPGGAIFSTEALDRAVGSDASLGVSAILGKIAQARAAVVKGTNYTILGCEATEAVLDA
jgi:HAMP domain-containing protein